MKLSLQLLDQEWPFDPNSRLHKRKKAQANTFFNGL